MSKSTNHELCVQRMLGKKITGIEYGKKKFIINTAEGDLDLMQMYNVTGRSLYLIEQMKTPIDNGSFTDGIIASVRKYEGDIALGKHDKIIKQPRLTLSISLKFKEDAKVPDDTLCITFCK